MTSPEWMEAGPQHRVVLAVDRRSAAVTEQVRIGVNSATFSTVISIAGSAARAAGISPWWRASVSSASTIGIVSSGVIAGWAAAF